MIPLVGLLFRGATLAEPQDLKPNSGRLGRPVWSHWALLEDLELRLGISQVTADHGVRLQKWSQRLLELSRKRPRFYSASYAIDPIGTAKTLLSWRDQLVEAGWNGELVEGGGERLATFFELEQGLDLPLGFGDRLRRVEEALQQSQVVPWSGIELAEGLAAWPARFRRVFRLLEERGVVVRELGWDAGLEGKAPRDSDLGRLQASIRGEVGESVRGGSLKAGVGEKGGVGKGAREGFRGDGSLIFLKGETSWELGRAVAALLARLDGSTVVVRGKDVAPLELSLGTQGLAGQGLVSESRWRPALQLLPLALELVYLPRDPYRVLELLTLPLGPFAGWVGLELARAMSEAPGIGGRAWNEAKRRIQEVLERDEGREGEAQASAQAKSAAGSREALAPRATAESPAAPHSGRGRDRWAKIAEWLEGPGFEQDVGAPRAHLLEVTSKVQQFLHSRLLQLKLEGERTGKARPHDLSMLGAAYRQAQAFHEALSHDGRECLDLVAVRQLLDEVSFGKVPITLTPEEAGRVDFVDGPAGLRTERDTVVWWHCVDGTQDTISVDPWRSSERAALEAAGIKLPDRAALLSMEVEAWRRVVLAANRRLILVVPSAAQGERLDPHPLWDELVARAQASSVDVARVTLEARKLLDRERELLRGLEVEVQALSRLALPEPRALWQVSSPLFGDEVSYSATSLERIVSCPLSWVFEHRAGLRATWALEIPSGPLLNGRLGHRLIEELYLAGAFRAGGDVDVASVLERLIDEEAAVLRRPGMTFELAQLRRQLIDAVQRLAEILQESGLSIAEVESKTSVEWAGRTLEGRLDLLLCDASGKEVVLDLKWGKKSYEDKLKAGLALQLATYAAARKIQGGLAALPHAAYYSLSGGSLLTTEKGIFSEARPLDGPSPGETWKKVERTIVAVERLLRKGTVAASGLRVSPPLLESAGVPEPERDEHVESPSPCDYCRYGTLCGKAWENWS